MKKVQSHKKKSNSLKKIDHNKVWICGKHPVFTTLKQSSRQFFEILVTKNSYLELEKFLEKNSLSELKKLVKISDKIKIESLIGENQIHQGIAVLSSKLPIKNQFELLEELHSLNTEQLPTLLLLDQISDPHNVGAIIRSAVAFGVKKIIFSEHNSIQESPTIIKSSAGNIEFASLYSVTNFSNLIEKLKKLDYWCAGLAGEGTTPISKLKEYKNIALIIGSEGSGIRPLVKKNCDFLTKIEIDKEVESLNASVAASIALYELKTK